MLNDFLNYDDTNNIMLRLLGIAKKAWICVWKNHIWEKLDWKW